MAIISYNVVFPGQNQKVRPRFGHLYTNDTSAAVATAGYVNPYILSEGYSFEVGDFIFAENSDANHIYTVSKSGTTVTLVQLV